MTAEKTTSCVSSERPWISTVLVLVPAALGIAAAAAVLSSYGQGVSDALSRAAAGYAEIFSRPYTFMAAFSEATAISRADIAVYFIAMLFPYTAASRPLTVLSSFLRPALTTFAVIASASSPLGAASLLSGVTALFFVLRRADVLYIKLGGAVPQRPCFRDCADSALTSIICSGAVIAARTVLLLLGGLLSR